MTAPATISTFTGVGAQRLLHGPWRVVVTGAGGWLGLATLEMLSGLFRETFEARVAAFGASARVLTLRGGLRVEQQGLDRLGDLPPEPSLVFHNAFLTQEKARLMSDEAYEVANRAISAQVMTALDNIGAEAVFLPSSGAVYMVEQPSAEISKQIYGRLKLEDETQFAKWAADRGRAAVIARVFNLSGPYINKQSSYALASFIADALAGRPITIRADRPVVRSYVAIAELMSLVVGALTEPAPTAMMFDTAGDGVYEMAQVAEIVQEALGRKLGVDRPAMREGAPDRYVGDGAVYRALRHRLGVAACGFPDQVKETARFMAQSP
ncbi:MAG TPA: NAD(P)-dependent oxidoreductase [Caulobacteraceae bacterium]